MAASFQTITNIVEVVRRHVDDTTFKTIVNELRKVEGNASFKMTIERIYLELEKAKRKGKRDPK